METANYATLHIQPTQHREIKIRAAKKGTTMIEYVQSLLDKDKID